MIRLLSFFHAQNLDAVNAIPFSEVGELLECRAKMRLPEHAQSAILCLLPYYIGAYPERNISRYCLPDDYHTVGGGILENICAELRLAFPGESFVWFIDSSPIREVQAAHRAGLGVVGKNRQLIHPAYGSYCFIGEIITTMRLEPLPQGETPAACIGCDACIKACPTGALTKTGLNKTICRSEITQKKGELTGWEQAQVADGSFIWGCDRCTDCCPMNQKAKQSPIPAFYEGVIPVVNHENLAAFLKRKAAGWRGDKPLLRNLALITEKEE